MQAWLWLAPIAVLVIALTLAWATRRLPHERARRLRLIATASAPALVALVIGVALSLSVQAPAPAPPPPAPDAARASPQPAPVPPQAAASSSNAGTLIGALTGNAAVAVGAAAGAVSSPPAFDPAAFVRAQVAALVPGEIVFNPPDTMREGQEERITVRIARGDAEAQIKTGLQGRGVAAVESIQVGTFMRVHLYGDGFAVTARSDENQAVPETGFAEWLFDVLPEAGGSKELTLAVAVRFKLPGSDEVTDLPVLTRTITVQVDELWALKQLLAENWQWLLGGLASVLVALTGYFGRRWVERT